MLLREINIQNADKRSIKIYTYFNSADFDQQHSRSFYAGRYFTGHAVDKRT